MLKTVSSTTILYFLTYSLVGNVTQTMKNYGNRELGSIRREYSWCHFKNMS